MSLTDDELNAYITEYNNPTPEAMTQGGGYAASDQAALLNNQALNYINSPQFGMIQNSLPAFMDSGQYQLAYGNNRLANPADRFAADPGVQKAIEAGMGPLQAALASRGLGASGAASKAVGDYMYNHYNDFIGNQVNMMNNYQNTNLSQMAQDYANRSSSLQGYQGNLMNLLGMGNQASTNQANNAMTSSNLIANLIAQAQMQGGTNLSNLYQNIAGNLGSIYTGLGSNRANVWLGTTAAQANNILQGSILGSQIAGAQNASNAGSMSSMLQGQGAAQGSGYF